MEQSPDVVGLQDVTLLRIQWPGDLLSDNSVPATDVALDYLELLLWQLKARGACYIVAAVATNWDIALPMIKPTPSGFQLDDARVTDFDDILVRADLPPGHLRLKNSASGKYLSGL